MQTFPKTQSRVKANTRCVKTSRAIDPPKSQLDKMLRQEMQGAVGTHEKGTKLTSEPPQGFLKKLQFKVEPEKKMIEIRRIGRKIILGISPRYLNFFIFTHVVNTF